MENIWDSVLSKVRDQLSEQVFDTWFEPTRFISFSGEHLEIEVPNSFFRGWLYENYAEMLREILYELTSKSVSLSFTLTPQGNGTETESKNSVHEDAVIQNGYSPQPIRLNPKYTFSTFVVGNSNHFAHAAARAVAEAPSTVYNPLFLYGGVGLGKTHLMQAIGHAILLRNSQKRVVYIPAEQFMNEMINAFRFNTVSEFREKYRSVDILMIDDIQHLAGRERTQVEFFHTFNTLYESQKQIVISSDLFPKEIPTLEERLRSRFEWGLIADIQPPDLETKAAILLKKAELNNIVLPRDVAMFIAENITSNVRELEGCLIRVCAMASLTKKRLDLPFAQQVLKDIVNKEERQINVDLIQKVVARHFGIKLSAMKSRTRTKDIAFPRQIAMYLSRELTSESLPFIGREFGGKDHTTILYGCDKIKKQLKNDIALRKNIELLIESIRNC